MGPVISLVGVGGALKTSSGSGYCCLLFFPVHSLCACSKNLRKRSFAHTGLSLCWAFVCKTFLHHALSSFQFKYFLGVIFSLSSLQTLRDMHQLANKLSLLLNIHPSLPDTLLHIVIMVKNMQITLKNSLPANGYSKM